MTSRRPRRGPALGDLEGAVMNVVWTRDASTVRDVVSALAPERDLAYTTVMTVLSRLVDKKLLVRRREGRAFVYAPAVSRSSTVRAMLAAFTKRLYGGSSVDAIGHLIEDEPNMDARELDRLEALIRAKRKAR